MENIFTYNGKLGHEIVLVFDGAFVDKSLYGRSALRGRDTYEEFNAVWKTISELQKGSPPLYPGGLLERLSKL